MYLAVQSISLLCPERDLISYVYALVLRCASFLKLYKTNFSHESQDSLRECLFLFFKKKQALSRVLYIRKREYDMTGKAKLTCDTEQNSPERDPTVQFPSPKIPVYINWIVCLENRTIIFPYVHSSDGSN